MRATGEEGNNCSVNHRRKHGGTIAKQATGEDVGDQLQNVRPSDAIDNDNMCKFVIDVSVAVSMSGGLNSSPAEDLPGMH